MKASSFRILSAFLLSCLATYTKAYPSANWPPMYAQAPREYQDDDYYYSQPKAQYYYGQPARHVPETYGRAPEVYGRTPEAYDRVPYPYYYDPYAHYEEEDPIRQDERLAALPVGQETWYETETEPSWRPSDLDDVNAAFLDNLILTQMAQDAQRRREYARSSLPSADYHEEPQPRHDGLEDEDVRELKALAGKPLYHVPKTVPRFDDDDDDDYQADDGFINWNGNKRSVPATSTVKPKEGQDEIMVPRPASTHQHHAHSDAQDKKDSVYEKITQLLAAEARNEHSQKEHSKARKIDKRFVASDSDLVAELRGLKHRIRT